MFFFLLFVAFNDFITSSVNNKNVRLRLALAMPLGIPITVANDAAEMLAIIVDKKNLKTYKNNQKKQHTC